MLLTLLFTGLLHADIVADISTRLAQSIDPGPYTTDLQTRDLDLPTELPGRLYGAIAWKIVPQPLAKVRAFYAQPGAIFQTLAAVKTQRELEKLSESTNALELKLAIKVPVVRDYHTQDRLALENDRLSWRQSSGEGQLEYNQGYVQITPEGESACRVLVVGVHLIKEEHRVPWIGRGTAARFARTHYAGYIDALETVLRQRNTIDP